MRLLLLLLLLPWAAPAQELPPPGGWPLRPVPELRAVPEPPGGLVPYRQGKLWGFADTTGRVWIRPVFETEPPRFGAGLLLLAQYTPKRPKGRYKHRPRIAKGPKQLLHKWNERYGRLFPGDGGETRLIVPDRKSRQAEPAWLLNAHGEQLLAQPNEAIVPAAKDSWRAASRSALLPEQPELVAIETRELEPEWQRPGQTFTAALGNRAATIPPRLQRRRAFEFDHDFSAFQASGPRLYAASKVNWLFPHRMVWANGRCGDRRQVRYVRYRHKGREALFDARGRRLTDYRYAGMKRLLPLHIAYWHRTPDRYEDDQAADSSGLPRGYELREDFNGPARRYGLLDRQGREITPPLYARMAAVGPNSLWVVAVQQNRLHYGLIDTLGHYLLPLSPQPISLPDAAGLLRRASSAPLFVDESFREYGSPARYPDTATVQYLWSDGRPAFAGRFTRADAFWQGRALVQQANRFGLLDTLGRWILLPQPEKLRHFLYSTPLHNQWDITDPLELFDSFSSEGQRRDGGYTPLPNQPPLLLVYAPTQGYGLRDGRTGQLLVPAEFDKRPEQWYGGVVGQRRGQPLGYSYSGQSFNPNLLTSYPLGVWKPLPYGHAYRPLLQRTEQGWRTRGGRQLWED